MNIENKDIRKTDSIFEIVDCMDTEPYGEAAFRLIKFLEELPNSDPYNYLRTLTVPYLFHTFEKNLLTNADPHIWFEVELRNLKDQLFKNINSGSFIDLIERGMPDDKIIEEPFEDEVKKHTGEHYGNLFKKFNHRVYFEEAKSLLEIRLKRNKIEVKNLKDLNLLDQGCGGGRYTAAWKLLGVKNAVGIDYSEIAINDARKRVRYAGLDKISFDIGSVLNMPYKEESFDMVFCNGVLHHTEDWRKGVSEQLRVLKSHGYGWLYLIERPGGVFWDKIEILRAIMKKVNKPFARRILESLNIPANRVFYMLDHVMVPINTRLKPDEVEAELEKNGAGQIKRMNRGTNFDRIEYIYKGIPFVEKKFGVGENRYIFKKG